MLIGEMRSGEPGYPNENDMLTLGLAFDRAPQLAEVRLSYAAALIETDEKEDAVRLLKPLANNPHGGGASDMAARMIAALEGGEPSPTLEEPLDGATVSQPESPSEDSPESPPAPASE